MYFKHFSVLVFNIVSNMWPWECYRFIKQVDARDVINNAN